LDELMLKIGGQKIATGTMFLVLLDAVLIVSGLLLAVVLRVILGMSGWIGFDGFRTVARFAIVVIGCLLALYYNDLYDTQILREHSELFARLLRALGMSCAALALFYYLFPLLSLGRGVAALAAPVLLGLTFGARLFVVNSGEFMRPDRILMVGTAPAGITLTREILARPELGLKVIGFLDEKGENLGKSLVNPGIVGAVRDVCEVAHKEKVDHIVLSLAERRGTMPVDDLLRLKVSGIRIEDAHSCYERVSGRIFLEHLSPSWLILSDGFRKSDLVAATKRTMDFVISLAAILLTLPVMAAVAVAIWIETGSPILFRQERVGLSGRKFEILKFRSMRQDAEANGPVWANAHDQRITPVGRFLRKYRLDELPQLINVLRGDMSLVGPRPERPHFCAILRQSIPYFDQRHSVRPGITGWAQVKYQYGATLEESKIKLELDLFYIKHLSIFLDLAILFETVKVMLIGRGAQ
jgi:sugar transferase (PEP-CTERM system associated)